MKPEIVIERLDDLVQEFSEVCPELARLSDFS
jgi:hypothetical protein